MQLGKGARGRWEGLAGAQTLSLAVVQLAAVAVHDKGKDVVHGGEDRLSGTEIIGEQDLARLAGGGLGGVAVGAVFCEEKVGIGQTEAVDGLLDVADEEEILAVLGDGLENRLLNGVGILVFVDQDLAERGGKLPRTGGWLAGITVGQEADRLMLEVGKIEKLALALGLTEGRVKAADKCQKSLERQKGRSEVGKDGCAFAVEGVQRVAQERDCRFAQGSSARFGVGIFGFADNREAAKVNGAGGINGVPVGHGLEGGYRGEIFFK